MSIFFCRFFHSWKSGIFLNIPTESYASFFQNPSLITKISLWHFCKATFEVGRWNHRVVSVIYPIKIQKGIPNKQKKGERKEMESLKLQYRRCLFFKPVLWWSLENFKIKPLDLIQERNVCYDASGCSANIK